MRHQNHPPHHLLRLLKIDILNFRLSNYDYNGLVYLLTLVIQHNMSK